MNKVGIFYAPENGATHRVAKKVADAFGKDLVDLILVRDLKAEDINKYDYVVMGISTVGRDTWEHDHPDNAWDVFRPELEKLDYDKLTFALFGTGDHIRYPHNFVDAIGYYGEKMLNHSAKIIGRVSEEEYVFEDSKAVIDGKFIGLPIDEHYEGEKTEERIKEWVEELKRGFNL